MQQIHIFFIFGVLFQIQSNGSTVTTPLGMLLSIKMENLNSLESLLTDLKNGTVKNPRVFSV